MYKRKHTIGGSDATRIMKGDWYNLYNEIKGFQKPEDLEWKVSVCIGQATEALNRKFFEHESGMQVSTYRWSDAQFPDRVDWRHASYDGICLTSTQNWVPLECKHTYHTNNIQKVVETYYAQLHHYMLVSGINFIYLSVFFGNFEYQYCKVSKDKKYMNELIKQTDKFKQMLDTDTIPSRDVEEHKHIKSIVLDDMISIDYDKKKNNQFTSLATEWCTTKDTHDLHKELGKQLKDIIPSNCRFASGSGLQIARNKANHLSIRKMKGA